MKKILSLLLGVTCLSFAVRASDNLDFEGVHHLSIPQVNESEKTSLGKISHFPLKDTPIDLLKPIMGRVLAEDIIRLYITGNRRLIDNLRVAVEDVSEADCAVTVKFLQFFVSTFNQIRSLYLPQCNLTELPPGMSLLQKLRVLNLPFNRFKEGKFPPVILDLKQLEALDLSICSLTELPAEMFSLQNLRVLNLSFNRFKEGKFPSAILDLKQLEELNLACCGLKELPAELSLLSFLKRLNLPFN